jgi:hypothetical protein
MWVGWERGTQGVFGITPATTGAPTLFGEQINRYWVHKDPTFNWRSISEEQFLVEQRNLTKQFSQYIGSDSPDLKTFKGSGGKLIASYGNLDQIIPPNGHYNYMQRLFAKMGGVSKTQDFYRYYVFPNATHCGGAGMTNDVLFNALVNWVENGVAPDYVVAQVNPHAHPQGLHVPEYAGLHRFGQYRRPGELLLPDQCSGRSRAACAGSRPAARRGAAEGQSRHREPALMDDGGKRAIACELDRRG